MGAGRSSFEDISSIIWTYWLFQYLCRVTVIILSLQIHCLFWLSNTNTHHPAVAVLPTDVRLRLCSGPYAKDKRRPLTFDGAERQIATASVSVHGNAKHSRSGASTIKPFDGLIRKVISTGCSTRLDCRIPSISQRNHRLQFPVIHL